MRTSRKTDFRFMASNDNFIEIHMSQGLDRTFSFSVPRVLLPELKEARMRKGKLLFSGRLSLPVLFVLQLGVELVQFKNINWRPLSQLSKGVYVK